MRSALLTFCLIVAALPAAEVSDLDAYVQAREIGDGGKTIIAKVRVLTPGAYFVAGGYVINDAGKIVFYTGEKSKFAYHEVKILKAEAPGVFPVEFKLKAVPPLAMTPEGARWYVPRVMVFARAEDVPVYRPKAADRK
jgi:hypothetical protein